MYVSMHVHCMYVRMHPCMQCIHACMDTCMYVSMTNIAKHVFYKNVKLSGVTISKCELMDSFVFSSINADQPSLTEFQ